MRGSIDRRGKDSWRIRVYLGRHPETGRKRWTTKTVRGTRADADKACAKLLLEVDSGFHGDDHTVAELAARWLALVERDLSPATVRDYRYVLNRHVIPTLGDRLVSKVRTHELETWYRSLDIGPSRVRRLHNVLSSAFDQAVRWQWVVANPCASARPPKVAEKETRPPSPEEVQKLIDLARETDPDLAAYIHVAAHAGARRGEMVALRWSDVDLDDAAMTIRRSTVAVEGGVAVKGTKTAKTRVVSLDESTVAVLRAQRKRQRERALSIGVNLDDGPVFSSDPAGRVAWYPASVSRRFHQLCVRAGVENVRLHDLRHFMATQMIAAGVDVRTVAGRLGHRGVGMLLDRYAHFVPSADRAAAEELARILGQG